MKATCDLQMSSAKHSENKILKSAASKERDVTHEEMQSLLAKLKDLVPNVPRNRKLSKLEIIQYVIDYILDLQIALETHPAVTSRPASASLSAMSPCRQPLGVLPAGTNTCAAQEVTQMDKVPAHLSDAISTTRPVSC